MDTDLDFANTIFVSKFVCFFKQCIHVQEVIVTQIYGNYRVTFEEVIRMHSRSEFVIWAERTFSPRVVSSLHKPSIRPLISTA